jgi:hypothetical protein
MRQKSVFRVLVGAGFIGVAGISLTVGIFPVFVSRLFGVNSFEALLQVRGFVIPLALLWAVGGGIVGFQGRPYPGLVVVGSCGLVSGLVLGAFTLGAEPLPVIATALSGLVYGGVGGLLLGKAFDNIASEPQ